MFQPEGMENLKYCPVWPCQTYIGIVSGVIGGVLGGLIAAYLLMKKMVSGGGSPVERTSNSANRL
jgi:hypothetical protein